jgi:hypothetical protein
LELSVLRDRQHLLHGGLPSQQTDRIEETSVRNDLLGQPDAGLPDFSGDECSRQLRGGGLPLSQAAGSFVA